MTEKNVEIEVPPEPTNGWVPFFLGFYQILLALFALTLASEIISGKPILILQEEYLKIFSNLTVRNLSLTVLGSVIGMITRGLYLLQINAVEKKRFQAVYIGSYVLAPIAGSLIGVGSYALIASGLMAFGGTTEASSSSQITPIAYLALGLLSGFSWQNVLERLTLTARNMFAAEAKPLKDPKEEETSQPDSKIETNSQPSETSKEK